MYVRNLWTVIDSTLFVIRMQLARTYLIPVLLYVWEVFATGNVFDCMRRENPKGKKDFNLP